MSEEKALMAGQLLVDIYDRSLKSLQEKNRELERENEAIRTLMNVYNLGGWTDSIGPMKRALVAEVEVANLKPYKEAWDDWRSLQTGDVQKMCDAAVQYKVVQDYVRGLMHSCPTNTEVVKIAVELNALTYK